MSTPKEDSWNSSIFGSNPDNVLLIDRFSNTHPEKTNCNGPYFHVLGWQVFSLNMKKFRITGAGYFNASTGSNLNDVLEVLHKPTPCNVSHVIFAVSATENVKTIKKNLRKALAECGEIIDNT